MAPEDDGLILPPADPHPISESLQRHLDDVLAEIPSERHGHVVGAVTAIGFEASVGTRFAGDRGTLSGYVGKEWRGGYSYGVRGEFAW